ncbi:MULTISPECIES: peptidase E [Nocardia]|uniref:peptidase E n=1 Tax=Nocardia TaxID=1817 RepID=UPI000BEFC9C7|nr:MULTISPECIES: peptidase E [Nocardia]MBF6188060.1 peptidase E [Nocardia farcinica]MBF6314543.1 peptidase E [Nocardia farcinica]MBF6409946.1 peptidase E [Nocardia farcinica]PEH75062.1 peptidase E [Nocardia sp. FDAARGOS_372]UEX24596.1 peptidase E [Nocardia farcinica]
MPAERPTILATSMGFHRARDPWQPSPVFRLAFDLAGGPSRPRLCFVTTGTGDRQTSIDAFYAAFDGTGVMTSHLALFDKPNMPNVAEHLHEQDVIWVDRGSVVNLLAVWRAHGIDEILRDCWTRGVVMGGESAGSLCWFTGGTTDSFGSVRAFADGLSLLPFSNAVHYSDRREHFRSCVAAGELPEGYTTEAGAGLHFAGTECVGAFADRKSAAAYRVVRRSDGTVTEDQLEVRRLER